MPAAGTPNGSPSIISGLHRRVGTGTQVIQLTAPPGALALFKDWCMSIIEQIEDAIQVHCGWADRLKDAIETAHSEMTAAQAARDDLCAFGQWLYGRTIPDYAKTHNGWENAVQIHAEFHKCAAEVLDLALAGQRDAALKAMDNASLYTATSVMLVLTLRAWQIDIETTTEAERTADLTAAASPSP